MFVSLFADTFFVITIIQGVLNLTFSDRGTNAQRQGHICCHMSGGRRPSTVPILVAAILLADVIKHMCVTPHRLGSKFVMYRQLAEMPDKVTALTRAIAVYGISA